MRDPHASEGHNGDMQARIRAALRQHFETERLLGVRDVPLPPAAKPPHAPLPPASTPTYEAPPPASSKPAPKAPPPAAHDAPPARAAAPHTPHAGDPVPAAGRSPIVARRASVPEEELNARQDALRVLDEESVRRCTKCQLHCTRTNTVFGQGWAAPRLVFVGEAPGFEEDKQGLAFVGRAGQLLTKMIEAMGVSRDDVFICNVLKCRPPDNRTPAADEIAACSPYLFEQIRMLDPEVIVALGKPASQTLLNSTAPIGQLRGRFHDFYPSGTPLVGRAVPLMPTYHPAYLLRNPNDKGKAWEDLMKVMERLGWPIPGKYRR